MARKKNPDEMSDGSDGEEDFDYGEEPDFADPEDYVDDIDDEELMPEIMKQQPNEADGVDSVIVVDGVPVVAGERVEKLKNVIRKIYSKFGKLVNEHYPVSEDGSTKGYIFLEFSSHANAVEAVKSTNNYKLDKITHSLSTSSPTLTGTRTSLTNGKLLNPRSTRTKATSAPGCWSQMLLTSSLSSTRVERKSQSLSTTTRIQLKSKQDRGGQRPM